jgi:hypothetical protein
MDEKGLRRDLVALLCKGQAHVSVEKAIAGIPGTLRGTRPSPLLHSVYEELEHMRIAQEDILRYTLDPGWSSPAFPKGYWPSGDGTVTDAAWKMSVEAFRSDLGEVCALAEDRARDLTAAIPHGEGRTYLRQILLVADHNAYHAAQIVTIRKLLGDWKG